MTHVFREAKNQTCGIRVLNLNSPWLKWFKLRAIWSFGVAEARSAALVAASGAPWLKCSWVSVGSRQNCRYQRSHKNFKAWLIWLNIWLVVSTPLKSISQMGWLFPIYGKIKNVPNHQPHMKAVLDSYWNPTQWLRHFCSLSECWNSVLQSPRRIRVATIRSVHG